MYAARSVNLEVGFDTVFFFMMSLGNRASYLFFLLPFVLSQKMEVNPSTISILCLPLILTEKHQMMFLSRQYKTDHLVILFS